MAMSFRMEQNGGAVSLFSPAIFRQTLHKGHLVL